MLHLAPVASALPIASVGHCGRTLRRLAASAGHHRVPTGAMGHGRYLLRRLPTDAPRPELVAQVNGGLATITFHMLCFSPILFDRLTGHTRRSNAPIVAARSGTSSPAGAGPPAATRQLLLRR